MLLTPKPGSVAKHEQNILWSYAEICRRQNESGFLPDRIIETEGFFASDVMNLTPIHTIDGGYRQILRILLPVNPGYLGASIPIWEFVGDIVV